MLINKYTVPPLCSPCIPHPRPHTRGKLLHIMKGSNLIGIMLDTCTFSFTQKNRSVYMEPGFGMAGRHCRVIFNPIGGGKQANVSHVRARCVAQLKLTSPGGRMREGKGGEGRRRGDSFRLRNATSLLLTSTKAPPVKPTLLLQDVTIIIGDLYRDWIMSLHHIYIHMYIYMV